MASTETAKRSRTTAKGLFTKARRNLERVIYKGSDIEIVEGRMEDLKRVYRAVQEKHEDYLGTLTTGENITDLAEEDDWLTTIDIEFDDVEERKVQYIRERMQQRDEKPAMEEMEAATKGKQHQYCAIRQVEMAAFHTIRKSIEQKIDLQMECEEPILDVVKEELSDVKRQLEVCRQAHHKYISTLSEIPEEEIQWVKNLQDKVLEMSSKFSTLLQKKDGAKHSAIPHEKLKMPTFDGNIRDYPRFKVDFERQILPRYKNDPFGAAYALKSCLSKEPLSFVRNVDDNHEEMWKRLNKRYGSKSRFTDAIMNEIKGLTPVNEGDNKGFITLVNIVESGYRDLERLSLEKEMANSTAVSLIEDKLPRDIRKSWALEISKSDGKIDDGNKFPDLLKFLIEQKGAIEYDEDGIRRQGHIDGRANFIRGSMKDKYYSNNSNLNDIYRNNESYDASSYLERNNNGYIPSSNGGVNFFEGNNVPNNNRVNPQTCCIHKVTTHSTQNCREYVSIPAAQKIELVKENRLCFSCLCYGHRSSQCRFRKKCGIDGCFKFHHSSLHAGSVEGLGFHSLGTSQSKQGGCLLQLMKIEPSGMERNPLTVFFDGGATISLITFRAAKALGLKGKEIMLTVTKVGGIQEKMKSYEYTLRLLDKFRRIVEFQVYGIDRISTDVKTMDVKRVLHLFQDVSEEDLQRPAGEINVLIGFEYAGYHPVREQSANHLLVMCNRFGKCLGGYHNLLAEGTRKVIQHVKIHHLGVVKVEDFYNIEAMGVNCSPKCGGCKCGHCPLGGKNYTLKEERELKMIEDGLKHMSNYWLARYPWIRDPGELIDNYPYALNRLRSLERSLLRNPEHGREYQAQIEDMVKRGVAHKLAEQQIKEYNGPVYYAPHHAVWKVESESTPCRLVFDASANCNGIVINSFWAKGPDLINNLLGILLRFREGRVAVTGDIRKMYHAVKIEGVDMHTHRFLWRELEVQTEPSIYAMSSVSFGDRPAGNIAITALRKTAEMRQGLYPQASNTILLNSYVDDIADSVDDIESARKLTKEIDELLKLGGFAIKKWTYTSNPSKPVITKEGSKIDVFAANSSRMVNVETKMSEAQRILGMKWDPELDVFTFDVRLNFSPKRKKMKMEADLSPQDLTQEIPLTKRMILSQINRVYDPMGLAGPFTLNAKILMRQLWNGEAKSLGWDDIVPQEYKKEWITFFRDLFEVKYISFERCVKPSGTIGRPSLIIFSDGSNDAFGACAYIRWQKLDGSFESYLIASKNRITPLKRMSIVRSELCGAVLAKRLKVFIQEEMRIEFEREYFIVDSQIVQAMVQKDSYGFNTFVAVRIGEIQEDTAPADWYWVEGCNNIADWVTRRGKTPKDLDKESLWQKGADFLKLPVEKWPIKVDQPDEELPEQAKFVMMISVEEEETLAARIDLNRFSSYYRLLRVTARVLAMYKREPRASFTSACRNLTATDIQDAETFWFLEVQKLMETLLIRGDYKRLCPKTNAKGIIMVGGRIEKWFKHRYDEKALVLLPYNHQFTKLYAETVHKEGGHLGAAATVSKIRSRVWIPNVRKLVQRITSSCVTCKKQNKVLQQQCMAALPIERLKPSPPWSYTSLDFFGPFEVRGEVNKRSRGKAYGVLFNCLVCRAVYVDIACGYSTEDFLLVLRRFVSLRGYPCILYSDPGPQLEAASKELKGIIKGLNVEQIKEFGVEKGLEWKFSPADGPWQNGCSEALIKSVKKAISGAIGIQTLSVTEMQTVCFEAGNLVNERPIGRHPTDPDDGVYLCPNQLLLGRASCRAPAGPFKEPSNANQRFRLVQNITNSFWRQWTRDFFPSLLVRQKWHTEKRNVKIGDIVIVQDAKQLRGNWRLARVSRVMPSDDGKVRRVMLQYKNEKPGEAATKYTGVGFTSIERPVQRIVVVVPVDETSFAQE